MAPPRVRLRHASSEACEEDGVRVLVERRWPPGLTREQVDADLWLREIAPSEALLRWCNASPARWQSFAGMYRAELEARPDLVQVLARLRAERTVTLLSAAPEGSANCAAAVLRQVIEEYEEDHIGSR
jgi:uncharacterized protein YeaO (DUF488 family)